MTRPHPHAGRARPPLVALAFAALAFGAQVAPAAAQEPFP